MLNMQNAETAEFISPASCSHSTKSSAAEVEVDGVRSTGATGTTIGYNHRHWIPWARDFSGALHLIASSTGFARFVQRRASRRN